ncbi:DUF4244 domain-containing protein [Georgenia sp. 10Sc9-8]|uniref:DUF4244 domain-containing protein n=1 Tax=Georgenia halotolerans TaxID=3028317 RepID=A0ABT5U218_9MICO|nr:DUF4244 domain-containing protein [Georgenia halotolerans]
MSSRVGARTPPACTVKARRARTGPAPRKGMTMGTTGQRRRRVRLRRRADDLRRRVGTMRHAAEAGMATVEYAVATLAAAAFAGLLLVILRSSEVREMLTGIVRQALQVGTRAHAAAGRVGWGPAVRGAVIHRGPSTVLSPRSWPSSCPVSCSSCWPCWPWPAPASRPCR